MQANDVDAVVYQVVKEEAMRGNRATVSQVAAKTGLARSSIHRVSKKLGYASWLEFTEKLVRYYASTSSSDSVVQSVDAVAQALLHNKHLPVLVDAVGDAEICVQYLLHRLGERDFYPLPFTKHAAEAHGGQHGAGVAIGINESGMSLLRTCIAATENGFEVISLTSSHDTPVSKLSAINVVVKNNKSQLDSYEPNLFAAGALAFLERVLYRMGKKDPFL